MQGPLDLKGLIPFFKVPDIPSQFPFSGHLSLIPAGQLHLLALFAVVVVCSDRILCLEMIDLMLGVHL